MKTQAYLFTIILLLCIHTLFAQAPTKIISELGIVQATWSSDTTYLLDGYVFLEAGGTLTIEAGTIVRAKKIPSSNDPTTALIINPGAKIFAVGSYMNPIIFTAEGEDINDPSDFNLNDRGSWGGLILLGEANVYNQEGNLTSNFHPSIPGNIAMVQYGGTNNSSSSGILKNVSIRYPGASIVAENFSGLSLAGVGNESIIDSVEVYASGGDGISFLGGNVNTRYLSSSYNATDAFDWDQGFQGKGQFWFGLLGEDIAQYGIVGKGPNSKPIIYNATILGPGKNSILTNSLAVRFVEGSGGILGMSIFADFPHKGIEIEDLPGDNDSYSKLVSGDVFINSNIWSDFGSGNSFNVENGLIQISEIADDLGAELLKIQLVDSNYLEENYLPFNSRQPNNLLYPDVHQDFFIYPYSMSYPNDSFFKEYEDVCIGHGAFLTYGAWWLRYWTALDQDNYLMHPCVAGFLQDERINLIGGDSILIYCEDLDLLDFEYQCFNSFCGFANQKLALAMRMKRKKKNRIDIPGIPYCYIQNVVFTGEELMALTWAFLDSFRFNMVALVQDTTKPSFNITACDSCEIPVFVSTSDCDTAWIADQVTNQLNDSLIEYSWKASDRCNEVILKLVWNSNAPSQTWYEDSDGDGFGSRNSIEWQGIPDGFSLDAGDCDDSDPLVNPLAFENPEDNIDNDCDGSGNLETCFGSELLVVGETCEPILYTWNPSTLESNSTTVACNFINNEFEGDIWFALVAPPTGELRIEFTTDFGFNKNLYRGTCDQLELVNCSFSLADILDASDLVPGELLYLQMVYWNDIQESFSICAQATGEVITTKTKTLNQSQNIKLWPNPTSRRQTITFESNNASAGSLDIYSITGSKIKTIFLDRPIKVGQNKISFDTSDFPNGPYWLKLETDNEVYVCKGIKM